MDKRFLKAFLTPKATILLGKPLKPWCLKHRIQLAALENPIVTGGPVTPFDLLVFAKVCSEMPFKPSLTLSDRWHLLRLRRRGNLMDAVGTTRDHMKTEDWPQFWQKSETSSAGENTRGVPWALSVIANLVKHGVSHEEALHLPEAYALWLSTALGIHDGARIDILTTEQEELLDDLSRVERPPK